MQVETEFLTQNAKRSFYWKLYSKKCHSFSFRFERGGDARRFKKYVDRNKVSQTFSLDLPVIERNLIYICRAMFALTSLNKYVIALSKGPTAITKKSWVFWREICSRKKRSALLNGVWCWSKNILSLLAGKNLALSDWFSPTKSSVYFLFYARLCSNPQNFFSPRQPSIRKKK